MGGFLPFQLPLSSPDWWGPITGHNMPKFFTISKQINTWAPPPSPGCIISFPFLKPRIVNYSGCDFVQSSSARAFQAYKPPPAPPLSGPLWPIPHFHFFSFFTILFVYYVVLLLLIHVAIDLRSNDVSINISFPFSKIR